GIHLDLRLRPEEERRAEMLLASPPRPFAAFFLGSRWPSRFWFPQATAAVAQGLRHEYGMGIVLLGGRGEAAFARAVNDIAGGTLTDLTGQASLGALVGILSRSHVTCGPGASRIHVA